MARKQSRKVLEDLELTLETLRLWAEMTKREPFVSAYDTAIKKTGDLRIIWKPDNTIVVNE